MRQSVIFFVVWHAELAYIVAMDGNEFKKSLKKLGISQRAFAKETGMSVSAVNEWATDRAKMPSIAVAYVKLKLQIAELGK